MKDYYEHINALVQDLLVPARCEKTINEEIFNEFYKILIELESEYEGKEYIPREIAGLLFFIYRTLSNEASYCNYKDKLFIATGKIEEMIDKILWDSPLNRSMY